MQHELTEDHRTDEHGRPDGGTTFGPGLAIEWAGPYLPPDDPSTATVETVLVAVAGRLEWLQRHGQTSAGQERALELLDAAVAALHR